MGALKKDHVMGAGSAALAAGVAGAAIGAVVGGPPGLAIGAVAGGALGALVGDRIADAADSGRDLGHFEQIYHSMPYFVEGHDWNDYAPVYRYALDAHARLHGAAFDQVETQLHGGWEAAARFGSRLDWERARPAMLHAWQSLDEAGRDRSVPEQAH
ncbi:hypothetical protein [Cognatiluteimonas profundi]|uniref:hypothetical protein n=1 Tax=Cognatiluteimonas profundi TaxID=2594501 RepID=UPI00131D4C95|nr:hypothetical protein [Lysobacter profundi]